jgi:pyruvate dehydrogenase E1 component
VQLLGSGTILREVITAKALLQNYGVEAQVWSAPSFNELYREAWAIERDNRLHPEAPAKVPYVTQCLAPTKGPILAATDYVRAYAEPIRAYLGDRSYTVLGTDGFGRSDTRRALRQFFEVDSNTIAYASLKALYDEKAIELKVLQKAMKDLGINPNKENPVKC